MRCWFRKIIRFLILFGPMPAICQAPDSIKAISYADSLATTPYIDSLPCSYYISIGASVISLYNDNFVNFLYKSTPNLNPGNKDGTMLPNDFSYSKSLAAFSISGGVELVSDNHKWLHHQLEIRGIQIQGDYAYTASYTYTTTTITPNHTLTQSGHTHDDVHANYKQGIFVLAYKFQPSAKYFFASLGVNAYMNFVKVTEQTQETLDFSYPSTFTKSAYYNFTNLPMQIGGGCYLRTKRILFKPAFYVTPSFSLGYCFYTFSLGIGYRFGPIY